MLRPAQDQQIPSDHNFKNIQALRPSPKRSVFAANAPTFSRYLAPFRSQTDPLPDPPPQSWNRTEVAMASSTPAKPIPEHSYGVLRSNAKVAKGIQTDEAVANVTTRKRCWRHRRSSADKSRRSSGSENELSRKEANSNIPSPNKLALRSALLPNVSFPKWTRTSKQPPKVLDDDPAVSSLVDSYLLPLYSPSVRPQLTSQAAARCRDSNLEHFEAHCLGPTAGILRTVREYTKSHRISSGSGKKKRRVKKPPQGWPLCARGCLIVHICEPPTIALRPGDCWFVATPVGISLKWLTSRGKVKGRSLDAREFSTEMDAMVGRTRASKEAGCNFPSKPSSDEEEEEADEDSDKRSHLIVSPPPAEDERGGGGIGRIRVERLLEELWEGGRGRSRGVARCTRDSWVQTTTTTDGQGVTGTPMVAPLASEEEFCSDTEPKSLAYEEQGRRRSPLPQVRQPTAIAELDKEAVASQAVTLPGSRDVSGRSVVNISLRNLQDHGIEAVQLAQLLLYFQTIPKKESMCLGFLVLVDGRSADGGTWTLLQKTLAIVEETIPGTISLVLVLHKHSHSPDFLSSKYPIFHIKFEAIVNENQLLQYIAKDQLLPEYSGTFAYDHKEWIQFHESVDPFVTGCQQMGCRLVQLIQELRGEQLPSGCPSQRLIEEQRHKIADVLGDERLKYLEEEGAGFLKRMEERENEGNPDFQECVERSRTLYKQLKKVVQRLGRLADKRLNKLQERVAMKAFEEESSQVLTWLNRKGEETLKKHKTLAETLNTIREQENEFEKFYFLAMRQIERGNDLLEEIPKAKGSGISSHLKRHLEDFTDRLEDARERLEDTARCYTLLDKTYEWALETMRFLSHLKVDSSTPVITLVAIATRLDTYLQTHPRVEEGVFEDMSRLAGKLDNEALSLQCQTARAKYEETVELIQARRDALAKAKERSNFEEMSNMNESLDNLKIKPCLWNPLSQNVPYRTASQTYLGSYHPNSQNLKREAMGSYTSFPSSYYPNVSFRDRLLGRKSRAEYFSKRGSLTEELFLRLNRPENGSEHKVPEEGNLRCSASETHSSPSRRPSYPLSANGDMNDGSRSEAHCDDRLENPQLNHRRTSLPFVSSLSAKSVYSDTNSEDKFGLNGSDSLRRGRKSYPFTSGDILTDLNAKTSDSDLDEIYADRLLNGNGGKFLSNDSLKDFIRKSDSPDSETNSEDKVLDSLQRPYPFTSTDILLDLNTKTSAPDLTSEDLGSFTRDILSDLQNLDLNATPGNKTSESLHKSYPFSSTDIMMNLNQKISSPELDLPAEDLISESSFSRDMLTDTKMSDKISESLQGGRKSHVFSSSNILSDLNAKNVVSESLRSRRLYPSDSMADLVSRSKVGVESKSLASERNWKLCEADLKRFADEVREQNRALEEMRLSGQQEAVNLRHKHLHDSAGKRRYSHASTEESPNRRPSSNSHLLRCASCSDFEELFSSKTTEPLSTANNRTLKLIMMEMVQTERDYVKSLGYIIENYVPLLQNSGVSQSLRSQRNILFGNIEKIYEFHNCYFLEELEQCESTPYSVGQCFLKYESQFYLYALYNKNKPKSDSLMAEYGNFFKKKQLELCDKMDLASYLLKPVQRMGKYALLLKQLLKECPTPAHTTNNTDHYNNLKAAEEMVRFQLRHGNDLLAMDALRECDVNMKEQGRLLRQDEFLVWVGKRKALRHVFLFEDLILFSKARRDCYQYKSSIKTSDLGLTAQVGESPTKFEIWFRKCRSQYVLQAPSAQVRASWVEEITSLLWKQAERNRNLRLEEMSSMGIGNKPCLDITPSRDQICDRSISLQQLNKVPRFRNSIAVSSNDNFNNNDPEPRPRRPLSIISLMSSASSGEGGQSASTFYDTTRPLQEEEEPANDKRRSMAQQSQCSAESGIFMELSTSGDSYAENVQRLKTVERCDSVISRTSYNSIETEHKEAETSTSTCSPSGLAV